MRPDSKRRRFAGKVFLLRIFLCRELRSLSLQAREADRQLTAALAAAKENLARRQQFTLEDGERLTTEAGGFSYQTTRVVIGHRMLTDLAEKETEH
jgi:hypothetical protein